MWRIAITGPESSGKTTLAKALAAHFGAPWVPEYARAYLQGIGRPYQEEDLLHIAEGQLSAEREAAKGQPDFLFCDSDTITIRIWSMEKYGRVSPELERSLSAVTYDHTLLCRPDLPWEPDPLRENPHDRDRLFTLYEEALKASGRSYTTVHGDPMERLHRAVHAIEEMVSSTKP